MRICLFEDAGVARLHPLTQTRPAFDLRCGSLSLGERTRRNFGVSDAGVIVRPELVALCRLAWPDLPINDPDWLSEEAPGGVVLVNARWLAPPGPTSASVVPSIGLAGDQVAYVALPATEAGEVGPHNLARRLREWREALPACVAGGSLIDHPWDLVDRNAVALEQDYLAWRDRERLPTDGLTVQGPRERLIAHPSAHIEPHVLIDTTRGPVLIDEGAVVQAFSRVEGPCYVGPGTQVSAGRIKGSSFGPQCRIGGEVESSIVQGFSNKAHEGFLGHSYVGEWVNLGASTNTSDLRNDYMPVSVPQGGGKVDTGLLKVGSFIGDHTKTSIDTQLNTGSAIGPFAMLVASGTLMPRYLPAFCQVINGTIQERTDLRQTFATASAMMARRGVAWTEAHADFFLDLYERTAAERAQLLHRDRERQLRRVV
jgi:UDP-N-acetylglucosamine diphosphorylase/glucosamine-1-phosphate N-acetyltransferase